MTGLRRVGLCFPSPAGSTIGIAGEQRSRKTKGTPKIPKNVDGNWRALVDSNHRPTAQKLMGFSMISLAFSITWPEIGR